MYALTQGTEFENTLCHYLSTIGGENMNIKYIEGLLRNLSMGRFTKLKLPARQVVVRFIMTTRKIGSIPTSLLLAIKMAARTSLRAIKGCRIEGICNP